MLGELLKGFFPSPTASSKGSTQDNGNYDSDDEVPESLQTTLLSISEQHAKDFDQQNDEADKYNPRGLINEPDMFEDAPSSHDDAGTKDSHVEMDLD